MTETMEVEDDGFKTAVENITNMRKELEKSMSIMIRETEYKIH